MSARLQLTKPVRVIKKALDAFCIDCRLPVGRIVMKGRSKHHSYIVDLPGYGEVAIKIPGTPRCADEQAVRCTKRLLIALERKVGVRPIGRSA